MAGASLFGAKKAPVVSNVEPPCWWVGMNNDTLQIMVTGPGIGNAEVSADYPGVTLAEQVKLDSPNYKFLYLTIAPDARPGKMPITFSLDGRKTTIDYPLLARDRKGEDYQGFDASDVLYLLMPDRFAKGEYTVPADAKLAYNPETDRSQPSTRHGGNIQGIRDHLDYIDSLGVTAIWSCPVLENDMQGGSYHGYATTNYYKIDPRFGTNADWSALVADAQKRGIKVVMDMIFNHSGSNHPWMKDMPSADWYNFPDSTVITNHRLSTHYDPYASDADKANCVGGWFVTSMPDLNQRNPHLMTYLIQNSIWWIETSKINGIRMDTYPYADMKAMARWIDRVMEEYPNFNIVGECWYGNEAGSAFWQRGSRTNPEDPRLPTVMDFKIMIEKDKTFYDETLPWGEGLNNLYNHLALDYLFPDPQHILTFLDNHDTDRFLAEMPDSLDNWKQAIAFLLTSRGIPQLYYGTELLMNGSKKVSDGYIRLDMPGGFPGDSINSFTPEGRTALQNEAWNYMQRLLQWRRGAANDVIAKGSLKHFAPSERVYAYERRLGDKKVLVFLNGSDEEATMPMARLAEAAAAVEKFTDLITGEPVTITEEMVFAPRQTMILYNF